MITEHPDALHDLHRLNQISRGGKQAIETTAMNAMYDAIERGASKDEASKVYFSFFNNKSHESSTSKGKSN